MNNYDVSTFIIELMNALTIVVQVLKDMTIEINNAFISVWDLAIYSGLITLIMHWIKGIKPE